MSEPEQKYNDYPFEEITKACLKLIKDGADIYQKFTCAGCGQRLMIEETNVLYTSATCDKCGYLTDIRKQGCNYTVLFGPSYRGDSPFGKICK